MNRIGYIALIILLILYAVMFRNASICGEPWCFDEPETVSWSMA